ncbi:zinc-dependent alcohol dehydrogenase family protein [Brevibacillus invocatus]|uniref:zinc-dependent alcohol dehydrogenase family protein n=1 Tax=Brevibacillus invocatus TaxID=173959 RepID=UPI00204008F7|nr:zinc-dependent alcohol dehydrogenase family protein [Brevibacillus invocatus]MCM3081599.1 zinc-dependent alcohol dehydrogenase family protein [Brevibacillus invocatus]MCM3431974.1 zinc-dependent alcohol dehydrogenase family protein [Brevibacillus invocatus]
MKALVLQGQKNCVVQDVETPTPGEDSILVKVMANGVCRSDWHVWEDKDPVFKSPILGHEFCGVVEEVGKNITRFKKGDRVIAPFSGSEGTCPQCQQGHTNICDSFLLPGFTYPGGYAEYVSIPLGDRNLVHLPEEISFVDGAALGCRFMTSFHGVVDQAQVKPGEWVVVYGCGGIGLSAVHIAAAIGANVIGVDINQANLELAKQMGAVYAINSRETDPVEAVLELTKGGADVSIDALGYAETCVNGIRSLKKRGRHLQIGLTSFQEQGIMIPVNEMLLKEIQFLTTFGMPAHRFGSLLPLVATGKLTPGKMVNREISLSEVSGIFEAMSNYTTTGTFVVTKFE